MRLSGGKVLAYAAAICSTCSHLVGAITLDLTSEGTFYSSLLSPWEASRMLME